MIDLVAVDVPRTFQQLMLIGVEAKPERNEEMNGLPLDAAPRQARNKQGVPQWVVTLAATYSRFGKAHTEIMNVTVDNKAEPCDGMGAGALVTPELLQMGIMTSDKGKAQVFFKAGGMVPVNRSAAAEYKPTATARAS